MTESAAFGDAKTTAKALFFSRALATYLNPKRPDITGAIILYGLYLWQKMPVSSFGYSPKVNGQRGCYRSLSELHDDYPWLSEEAIRLALHRVEKKLKDQFVIQNDNPVAERGKLHFWLSPTLIKKYRFNVERKKGMLQVQTTDVVRHGMIEAILISNLDHVTQTEHNKSPLTDDEGRIYRELSPTSLTKPRLDKNGDVKSILPCARKAVIAALKTLKAKRVFVEHPQKAGFYRLDSASEAVPKVADDVPILARRVPKVANAVPKLARQNVASACKMPDNNDLCSFPETSDTNTSTNTDTKSDSKCISHSTAELRSSVECQPLQRSDGAAKLIQFVEDGLEAYRHKQAYHRRDQDQLHQTGKNKNDHVFSDDELPYDIICIDPSTGKPYTRSAEIDYTMEELRLLLTISGFPYTSKDMDAVRELLKKHFFVNFSHLEKLLQYLGPQTGANYLCPIKEPKKGHDLFYWARRINNLSAFLRYLPQLVKEFYLHGSMEMLEWELFQKRDKSGKPLLDYRYMPEPYLSLAFYGDTTHPITTTSVDPNEWCCSEKRPVYYGEFVGLPTTEVATHECNPIEA